jgi:hypothetical protein
MGIGAAGAVTGSGQQPPRAPRQLGIHEDELRADRLVLGSSSLGRFAEELSEFAP